MSTATLDKIVEEVKALSPKEQYELRELIERMLEEVEDRIDLEDAIRAETEAEAAGENPLPWDEVKRELGI